jgi:hypothetical protein
LWDFIPTDLIIQHANAGNHGLAAKRWQAQLDEIRRLPETQDPIP